MGQANAVFKAALGRSRRGSSFSRRSTRRTTTPTASLRLGGPAGTGAIANATDQHKRTWRTFGKKS